VGQGCTLSGWGFLRLVVCQLRGRLDILPLYVLEGVWKGDYDLRSVVCSELEWVDRRGCGPAGGQWDNQDGQAAAGSDKDCGVGQGCTLPGWGFMRLVGWQYRKINKTNHM